MSARARRLIAFAGGVGGAALVLLATTQPWFTAHGEQFDPVDVAADVAAPSATALAVAALALVGAVAIANTGVRRVLGLVQLLLGIGVAVVTAGALGDAVGAVGPAVSEVTGISGAQSIASLITAVDASPWPWLALVGAGILILTGAWTVLTAPKWPAAAAKYDSAAPSSAPATDWDALSEGTDPTD